MDEELAKLFAAALGQGSGGATDVKSQKALMAYLQSKLNYGQDFSSSLFDPEVGALTGTYSTGGDGYDTYPESTPLVDLYRNDTGTLGMVANGLYGGVLSPIAAQKMVMDAVADPASDLYGFPVEQALDSVNALASEVASNNGKRTEFEAGRSSKSTMFSEAGLPDPGERFTAQTAPKDSLDTNRDQMLTSIANDLERRRAQYEKPLKFTELKPFFPAGSFVNAPTKEKDDPLAGQNKAQQEAQAARRALYDKLISQGYTEGVAQSMVGGEGLQTFNTESTIPGTKVKFPASSTRSVPDRRQLAERQKYEKDLARFKDISSLASARAEGAAAGEAMMGRTPLTEALKQKAAMMRALGIA